MWKPASAEKSGMKRRVLCLVGGWGALVLYLAIYAPAGMGLAALVGSFDSNHQVQMRSVERGLALVLHHGRNCAEHRHGVVARALTCLAQPASATDPDHVIQFAATDTLARTGQIALPPLWGFEGPSLVLTEVVQVSCADNALGFARPRPPPGECGLACCLRTTILLI
jgi:hypothetical protein